MIVIAINPRFLARLLICLGLFLWVLVLLSLDKRTDRLRKRVNLLEDDAWDTKTGLWELQDYLAGARARRDAFQPAGGSHAVQPTAPNPYEVKATQSS